MSTPQQQLTGHGPLSHSHPEQTKGPPGPTGPSAQTSSKRRGRLRAPTGRPARCLQGSARRPGSQRPPPHQRPAPRRRQGRRPRPRAVSAPASASRRGPDAALPQAAGPATTAPAAGPASRQPQFDTNARASRSAPAEFRVAATQGRPGGPGRDRGVAAAPWLRRAGPGPPSEQSRHQTPACQCPNAPGRGDRPFLPFAEPLPPFQFCRCSPPDSAPRSLRFSSSSGSGPRTRETPSQLRSAAQPNCGPRPRGVRTNRWAVPLGRWVSIG